MATLHSSDLHRIFATLDQDGDGHVDVRELSWLLNRVGVSTGPSEVESIIGGSSLDLEEFIFLYESISRQDGSSNDGDDEADLIEAFKVFDQNNDGFITSGELQNVLSSLGLWEETGGDDCTRMIREFDMDSDGRLDFNEFKNMMLLTIG